MAFDWSKLEGYREDMTAEEKVALMEGYQEPEQPKVDVSKMIAKSQFDKVTSELADVKKQLRAKMTDEEQREETRKAAELEMKAELEELRKEKKLATLKASYLAQGYNDELATRASVAMVEDDTAALFAVMATHSTLQEKALRASILKDTPTPPAGEGSAEEIKQKAFTNKMRIAAGLPPLK